MQKQNGNFLLQALLALTLVFSFLPFLANKLASRDATAKLYSVKETIDTAQNAARLYVNENQDVLNYGTHCYYDSPDSTKNFFNNLQRYGLPFGFNTKTVFNQDIDFVIKKTQAQKADSSIIETYLRINQGNMTNLQFAELARMIGMYGVKMDSCVSETGCPEINGACIIIYVPFEERTAFQNVLLRNDPDAFATTLYMGSENGARHSIIGFSGISGVPDDTEPEVTVRDASFSKLIIGQEKAGNNISLGGTNPSINSLRINGTVTYNGEDSTADSPDAAAGLSIHGNLQVNSLLNFGGLANGKTKQAGITPITTCITTNAELNNLSITPTGTYVEAKNWVIDGVFKAQNMDFNATTVTFNNVTLSANGNLGSANNNLGNTNDVGLLSAHTLVLNNTDVKEIEKGEPSGFANMDPGATVTFNDFKIAGLDWKTMSLILDKYNADDTGTTTCIEVLNDVYGRVAFDNNSLGAFILCKYILLERLERKIKAKLYSSNEACKPLTQ